MTVVPKKKFLVADLELPQGSTLMSSDRLWCPGKLLFPKGHFFKEGQDLRESSVLEGLLLP